MKFGVNSLLFSGTFDQSDLGLVEHVNKMGFDAFEVTPVDPDVFPAKELRKRAEDLGMTINANFAMPVHANPVDPDPAVRKAAVELSKKVIDLVVEAGAEIYCGANYVAWGYLPGRRRTQDEWTWGVEHYRAIGEHAKGTGLTIGLETLGRFESYYINTAADACAFVDEVGLPNCKVHLDTFHMIREENNIGEAIRQTGDRLCYFHACGSHRGIPGQDVTPWDEVFMALREVDYDYIIGLESFNAGLENLAKLVCIWRDFAASPDDLATQGLAFVKEKYAEYYS